MTQISDTLSIRIKEWKSYDDTERCLYMGCMLMFLLKKHNLLSEINSNRSVEMFARQAIEKSKKVDELLLKNKEIVKKKDIICVQVNLFAIDLN